MSLQFSRQLVSHVQIHYHARHLLVRDISGLAACNAASEKCLVQKWTCHMRLILSDVYVFLKRKKYFLTNVPYLQGVARSITICSPLTRTKSLWDTNSSFFFFKIMHLSVLSVTRGTPPPVQVVFFVTYSIVCSCSMYGSY